LNIPYNSQEAINLSKYLSWFISFHSWETSFELAKERGSFSLYDKNKCNFEVIEKVLYNNPYEKSSIKLQELKNIGVRNVATTGLPPTGSIAIIGGVNSSIEPFFALCYKRNITEGVGNIATDSIFEVNPALERKLKEFEYNEEQRKYILEYTYSHGTLDGCKIVSKEFQEIFKTANEIPWKQHIDIQAAWQESVSNAISKTANIAEKSTIEDVFDIYMYAYESGIKGITIYRENSKSFQILEKPNKN
jgi:ribonucleoside-diphosphate reductase alpha chain